MRFSSGAGTGLQCGKTVRDCLLVALLLSLPQQRHLIALHLVGDTQDLRGASIVSVWTVTPDLVLVALLQRPLVSEAASAISLVNHPSSMPRNRPDRIVPSPHLLDVGEDRLRLLLQAIGERFDVPGSAERVGDVDHTGLLP